MRIKTAQQHTKTYGAPNPAQLGKINALAISTLTADQVYVRTAYLAHNAIDRDQDVFDDALLDDFARTLPGKGLFIKHPRSADGDSGPGIGRWFEARVVEMSHEEARIALREPGLTWPPGSQRAKLLETSYYIPRSPKNADFIIDIDAGVAADVSIGFRAAESTPIQDGDGRTIAYRLQAPGEALEGSLVWLGAQPGARTVKATNRNFSSAAQQQIQQLKDENARLKAALKLEMQKTTRLMEQFPRGSFAGGGRASLEPVGAVDYRNPAENPAIVGGGDTGSPTKEPDLELFVKAIVGTNYEADVDSDNAYLKAISGQMN